MGNYPHTIDLANYKLVDGLAWAEGARSSVEVREEEKAQDPSGLQLSQRTGISAVLF